MPIFFVEIDLPPFSLLKGAQGLDTDLVWWLICFSVESPLRLRGFGLWWVIGRQDQKEGALAWEKH